jgi:hypothetical protein
MNKCDKQVYKDKNKLTLDDVLILVTNPPLVCLCLTHFFFFFFLLLSTTQGLPFTVHIFII